MLVFTFAIAAKVNKRSSASFLADPPNGLSAKRDKRTIAPSLFTPSAPGGCPDCGTNARDRYAMTRPCQALASAVGFMDGVPVG
ncbi:MAG: hypothetical protein ACK5M3_00520 [Dysgonomonas sp.]